MSKTRASPTLAIEVRGLRKSYGKTEAVRGVDLRVSNSQTFNPPYCMSEGQIPVVTGHMFSRISLAARPRII